MEFDRMMHELERLEELHPELYDPNSPTQRVGRDFNQEFTQVAHKYPMLSLGNTYSEEELREFDKRVCKVAGEVEYVCELKYDGTSISLTYRDGELVQAVTRGDGVRGDDVTANVRTIRTVPLKLRGDYPAEFEIRGEILMPFAVFNRLNQEKAEAGEPLFANPRNAAAGTLKLQNSAEVARRGLDAYLYYMLGEDLPCDNHYDNMLRAGSWGFKVSDAMTRLHSIAEIDAYIQRWDTARRELPVATDGLVFKVNSLRQQLNLGFRAKSPRWAIAYKFQAERALTRLRYVSFDVGRMGIVTPVANLEPVLLSGTIVKRASLHNEDIIKTLGIHEHDMLYVEKGGEIIPKITGVDIDARESDATPVRFVSHCPACGTPLVRVEGEAAWVCPDKYHCPPQIIGRIEHFVGRRMMNIEGIGEETAKMLYDCGLLRNIADLYNLKTSDLSGLEGFGQKSAERVVDGVERSKSIPFDRVLFALSIPYVGETTAKKIARSVRSLDRLMALSQPELEAIDDVGPRIAESIVEYFANECNRDIIRRLRQAEVQFELPEEEESEKTDCLAGKTIVISGVFTLHSRDQYKEMIERNGGKNSGSISKKTDFVLAGENMGPAKLEKARSLNIPVINEQEFLDMLS